MDDGMTRWICTDGSTSRRFEVTRGIKQGCVVAPTLFNLLFAATLEEATSACHQVWATGSNMWNCSTFQDYVPQPKPEALFAELLYADDGALVAHTKEGSPGSGQHVLRSLLEIIIYGSVFQRLRSCTNQHLTYRSKHPLLQFLTWISMFYIS